jgi:hypothetical protein
VHSNNSREGAIQEEVIKSFFHCIMVENTMVIIQVHILPSSNVPVLNMSLRISQKKTLFLGKEKEFQKPTKTIMHMNMPIRPL